MKSILIRAALTLVFIQSLFATRAEAYIDPGSGSFFVQMLLAGLLGAGIAIKSYWQKIKSFFGGGASVAVDDDDELDQP